MILQEIAQVIPGNFRSSNDMGENGDCVIVRLNNLRPTNRITFEKPFTVNSNNTNERQLVKQGDILFVCAGHIDNIGNVYKYNLPMSAVIGINIAIIRANDTANQELIYSVLNEYYYHFKILAKANIGAAMPRINLRQLKEFKW